VKQSILGVVAWLLYRLLSWTWRITWHEPACMRERLDQRRPFILAHWHGDELALLHVVTRYRLATLASPSKDARMDASLPPCSSCWGRASASARRAAAARPGSRD
jgi:lysophospholipid acyltransferase (LPLAT)-like uncharacterized protein